MWPEDSGASYIKYVTLVEKMESGPRTFPAKFVLRTLLPCSTYVGGRWKFFCWVWLDPNVTSATEMDGWDTLLCAPIIQEKGKPELPQLVRYSKMHAPTQFDAESILLPGFFQHIFIMIHFPNKPPQW